MAIQAEHGFSLWVAWEKATAAVVGDCGLQPFDLHGPDVELGYRHWGRGLATVAATACLRIGFEELGLDWDIAERAALAAARGIVPLRRTPRPVALDVDRNDRERPVSLRAPQPQRALDGSRTLGERLIHP